MRNAEATRERILEAALAEFSAYGIAGARVDRIAKTAGCNKNLIYVYFESKEALFTTVLQKNLVRGYEDVPFTADDLPGYAVRVFDFAMAHPDLMRLLTWFRLEQKADNPAERGESWNGKIAALVQAQKDGQIRTTFSPAFLMTTILTLAAAWSAASPYGLTFDPDAAQHMAPIRESIAEAVRILSQTDTVV